MTNNILVTTLDINREYDIIGPVFFEVTDAGGFFSQQLEELMERYRAEIAALRRRGATGDPQADWALTVGEASQARGRLDFTFYIGVQELKKNAAALQADAIIGLRQDIDRAAEAYRLYMYGTAVRFRARG